MWIIWLAVFVIALVIEAAGTDLVSIWFAAGALVALVLSLISGVSWWIELIVFVVISVAALLCLRPLVGKYMRRSIVSSNVDELKGEKAILVEKIDPLHHGAIVLSGTKWTAIAAGEGQSIKEGTEVEIVAISGNKLIVKEAPKAERKEQ